MRLEVMVFKEYAVFEIQISADDALGYRIVVTSPGGDASGSFTLPTSNPAYQALAARLDRLDTDEAVLTTLGQILFDALFHGTIKDIYTHTQGMIEKGQGLRIRLNIAPSEVELVELPWEFLCDPARGPLTLLDAPIMRSFSLPSRIPSLAITLPLKVLLTGAQVSPDLDVESELSEAVASLAELHNHVRVTLEPHLTPNKLQRLLRTSGGFHVWHFVGQSALSANGQTDLLQFEDGAGGATPISTLQLGVMLNRSGVRLAVLGTCHNMKLITKPLSGMAKELLTRAQMPAVVALQFTAPQAATRAFVSEFYRALAEGFPIDACVTEGRKAVMIATGLHRPDWGFPVVYTRAPDGKLFDLQAKRPLLEQEYHQSVGQGLDALVRLMQMPEVYAAVAACRGDLLVTRKRIGVMSAYKELHDCFQQLESSYAVISRAVRRLSGSHMPPDRQEVWEYLANDVLVFQETGDKVLDCAGQLAIDERDALWAKKLDRAQHDLGIAVKRRDAAHLTSTLQLVNDILGHQISRINTRLVDAAAELHLDSLVQTLRSVQSQVAPQLDEMAARQFAVFTRTGDNLTQIAEQLVTLVSNQDDFQQIEDELRCIEAWLEQDIRELENAWQDLKPKMDKLCYGSQASWAPKLSELGAQLECALSMLPIDPARVKEAFLAYRSQVNRSFNRVDWDLRTLCGTLVSVDDDLAPILRMTA